MAKVRKNAPSEKMAGEILKCGRNPLYFINHYCKIENDGLIEFKTWDFQDDCIKDFLEFKNNIVLKSRQIGMSTLTAAYATWLFLFTPHSNILIIATRLATAKLFIRKVKTIIKNLPKWMNIWGEPEEETKQSIVLKTGSIIKAVPTGDDAGRGEALTLLIVDEAAFIKGFDNLWTGLKPTLSATGGRSIVLSCVTGDTWVYTDEGPKQIKSFAVSGHSGGYEIKEYGVFGRDKMRYGTLFHNNGRVPTIKITSTHAKLEGSENHKLWTCQNGKFGWQRLDELSVGDWIPVQYGMNMWGNNDNVEDFEPSTSSKIKNVFAPKVITEDLAYFLGLFLAEGSTYRVKNKYGELIGGNVTISCGDKVEEYLQNLGLHVCCHDGLHHTISSKNLYEFLEYLGFDLSLHAKNKYIPSRLMQMSRQNIVMMLRGLFDGDGCSRKDRGEISIGLASRCMVEQIRALLLNFGILTEYREQLTKPTKRVRVESMNYRISLSGESSRRFYDLVGFRLKRKQDNQIVLEKKCIRSSSKDVIPNSLNLMYRMYEYCPYTLSDLRRAGLKGAGNILTLDYDYKTQNISRQNVIKMYDLCEQFLPNSLKEEVEQNVSYCIKWSQIQKIEHGEDETYDFSLPENQNDPWCHSVIYNGIIGHQTPNGVGGMYHKLYSGSAKKEDQQKPGEDGCNNFNGVKLPWQVVPTRNQTWFENECKDMSSRAIAQELECDFVSSGDNVISEQEVKWLRKIVKPPIAREGFDRCIWIWERPKPGHTYLIASDVSRGDAKDYSTFQILDVNEGEIVAEYQGKSPPDRLAEMLSEIGLKYNKALVCVEKNGYGYAVNMKLRDFNYPNIYYPDNKNMFVGDFIYNEDVSKAGFDTNGRTKPAVIAKLEEVLRNKSIMIYSDRFINELSTFIWHNGAKAQAMKGYNDDLIIAMAIVCWLYDATEYSKENALNNQILFESMGVQSTMADELVALPENTSVKDYCLWAPVAGGSGIGGTRGAAQGKLGKNWEWLLK